MKYLLLFVFLLIVLGACRTTERNFLQTETKREKDERMMWWRDAGFGMFIHWGLYAIPAGEYKGKTTYAEWIQEQADITVEEYEKYAAQFNPVDFNAEEWVKMAKEAGMNYIVITSKHHDGFSLWNSKVSDYDIVDSTPFKRDVLNELADACAKEGIVLCFYHSIMDWHHPDAQGINFPDYNYGDGPNPNFSNYSENYMKPQLKELLTNYGDIGVLWFDGEWINEWTEPQGKELYNFVRNLQPHIIINNRVGKGRQGMAGMNAYDDAAGDFGTPEQEILDQSTKLDWESCMTMNDHWGFNKHDKNFKSTEALIKNLIDIAAKGGNYLLNIGPTAQGSFPEESIYRLKEIGEWMNINSEIIHNSRGTKNYIENESIYYIKSKDGKNIYAVLTEWPGKNISIKYAQPVPGSKIHLLGFNEPLQWKNNGKEGIIVELPKEWQNESNRSVKHAWVIKMSGKEALVSDKPEFTIESKVVEEKFLFSNETEVTINSHTSGVKIYYEIINSKNDETFKTYDEPILVKKPITIRAYTVKDGFIDSPVNELVLLKTNKFESIKYKNHYSQKYSGLGDLTLGDGKFGGDDYMNKEWLGFEGVDFEADIDFGESQKISNVSVNFLSSQENWIFFPAKIEVRISDDGKVYKKVVSTEHVKIDKHEKKHAKLFQLNFNEKSAKYVKIIGENISICPEWHTSAGGKAWIFIDEVIVQ